MKNLSTMSSTQLDNIKFILTDIDDTLTTEGRLKAMPIMLWSDYPSRDIK